MNCASYGRCKSEPSSPEDSVDSNQKAFQNVADGDQDILDPTALEATHDTQPEFDAFVGLDP